MASTASSSRANPVRVAVEPRITCATRGSRSRLPHSWRRWPDAAARLGALVDESIAEVVPPLHAA